MGINQHTLRILSKCIHAANINESEARIALIGDLVARHLGNVKANEFFRDCWRFKEVLSFDINGKADIELDLCYPIDRKYHDYFDILINGGTAEHVENQQMFFDNCNNIVKRQGILLHVVPEVDSFKEHSEFGYYYDLNWVVSYANKYNYRMLYLERIMHKRGWAIYGAFRS